MSCKEDETLGPCSVQAVELRLSLATSTIFPRKTRAILMTTCSKSCCLPIAIAMPYIAYNACCNYQPVATASQCQVSLV